MVLVPRTTQVPQATIIDSGVAHIILIYDILYLSYRRRGGQEQKIL
jgi:hypothetical protein